MSIKTIVDAAEFGLVEVPRADWIAFLMEARPDSAEQRRWQADFLMGAKNAPSETVLIERSKARALCGLPELRTAPVAVPDDITAFVDALNESLAQEAAEAK